ncbi:DMT family transporter [Sporomusa aerivorans]|uniref:DMT family transporter n=1 Tax=Sporomusa aerivorans TaxID=204936 RepID=UPI00352AFDEC
MNAKHKSLLEIHISVLLFGLSGLFGKLIVLPPMMIVFGRVVFASIFLYLLLRYRKKEIRLERPADYGYMAVIGFLLAIHWSTFFLSIQISTVAIGLLTFSTFPVFVTFLEPFFFKEKIVTADIAVALITFLGVVLVVPEFEMGNQLTQGALWGGISGFSYALLSMMNRKYAGKYSGTVIAFYEQFIAAVLLLPFLFWYKPLVQPADIALLVILGIVFTGVAHSLFINGLKNIRTQTAGIISSAEPVYGIISAAVLLHEIPSLRELAGGCIILGAVLYSTVRSK